MVPVTVVIATMNRAPELRRTLALLSALPERPPIVVVDNASSDGTSDLVREHFPQVTLVRLSRNLGAAARNLGAERAATGFVAFSDDDSWWEPGALTAACELLHANPGVGLVAARVLVGRHGADDPLNELLAASPLDRDGLPGPRVLGFLGCSAVVRRDAFRRVGGYNEMLGVGGEEELLAMDLTAASWDAVYAPAIVARHWPSRARDPAARRSTQARNRALVALLRRPPRVAAARIAALAADPRALAGLAVRLPRALAARHRLPPRVESWAEVLDHG
jgi:GT2 family glycosyltransferase